MKFWLSLTVLAFTKTSLCAQATSVEPSRKVEIYTQEQIVAYYQALKEFQTEIEQERFSPLFEGSVKSTLRLSWDDPKLTFEILAPVPLKVTAYADVVTIENKGRPEQANDRLIDGLKAVTRFIRNLVRGEVKALSKDFDLSFAQNELSAVAKKQGPLAFIGKMKVLFGENMAIERITLETGDEKSILTIKTFAIPTPSPDPTSISQKPEPKKP